MYTCVYLFILGVPLYPVLLFDKVMTNDYNYYDKFFTFLQSDLHSCF